MSECVVRMEMSENCFECPFSIFDETGVWCNVITNNVYGYVERDEDCPIICQLPEGHGRLIDGDKLMGEMKNRKWMIGRASDPDCLVFDATTIVPAETERREICLD